MKRVLLQKLLGSGVKEIFNLDSIYREFLRSKKKSHLWLSKDIFFIDVEVTLSKIIVNSGSVQRLLDLSKNRPSTIKRTVRFFVWFLQRVEGKV
jgi:hypothetical protein